MVPESLVARLRQARNLVVSSHTNPDGDAIGSEVGLARILTALGKTTTIWNLHATPATYAKLPGAERIHVGSEPPSGFPGAFDLGVVLECPTLDRTGLETQLRTLPLVNIDHHLGNATYGVENWIDTARPAVGVMVADLARSLGATIDADTAACLYLALVTDTGGFRFGNATPEAFEAAADLVRSGAQVERVSQWLYESQSEGSIRLLGEMVSHLERHADGQIATAHLTAEAIARSGAAPGDTEGLIDTLRSIDGVEVVAMFRATGGVPGALGGAAGGAVVAEEWKVSLRSRGAVDVQRVAQLEGGGGHRNAAGCRCQGPIGEATARFVAHLRTALELARGR